MKTFTDSNDRVWTLSLNLGVARKLRERLQVDLLQPETPRPGAAGDQPLLAELGTDEMLLGEVLCIMLEGQFEAHSLSADDVRDAFDGATLLAAQNAFYEELVDFFRQRGRADRAAACAKQKAIIEAAVKRAETRITKMNVDEAIETAMGRGTTSGGSPACSGSAPTSSPA